MMTYIRASLVAATLAIALALPLHGQSQQSQPAVPAFPPAAGALPAADRAELQRQAQAALASIDDIDALMRLLPAEFFKIFEKSAFEQEGRAAMAQMKAIGFRIMKAEFGEPTTPYRAGRAIICFLPNTLVMQIRGRLIRTRGYFLAVRSIDGGEWKLLDGAGLDKHHDWLWTMFPDLPRDIQFPEWKQEEIKS
jgi:hypothetical protein